MKRRIIQVLLLIVLVVPFLFIGLTVKNSKDCDQLVIDTYEIHSGIDIPKVEYINCYYDDLSEVRLSIYSLKGSIYLDKYLNENKFEAIDLKELHFPSTLTESELPKEEKLYIATGKKWGHEWRYIVEKGSHRLWTELKYN